MTNGTYLHDVILDPISMLIYEYWKGGDKIARLRDTDFLLTTVKIPTQC